MKPVAKSQGKGIFLFRKLKDITDWKKVIVVVPRKNKNIVSAIIVYTIFLVSLSLSLSLSPTAGRVSKSARPASAAKGDARDVRGTAVHRQSVPYWRTEIRYPHLRPRHVLRPVEGMLLGPKFPSLR